ncbi:hypothetical protein BJY04DRAFT_31840 [Aspergillus karnatakaensis]|uniref:uncharacterized protein n=1 Tax=Aspergillus karnatakaensis TaxID=1810916 RepID=UPI003CCDFBC8
MTDVCFPTIRLPSLPHPHHVGGLYVTFTMFVLLPYLASHEYTGLSTWDKRYIVARHLHDLGVAFVQSITDSSSITREKMK